MLVSRKSRNLFGWLTKKKLAGSSRLSTLAYRAGQKSGDTGEFSLWLKRHQRGETTSSFRKRLADRYRAGVEAGETKAHRQDEIREEKQHKKTPLSSYKATRMFKWGTGEYGTSIDDSRFESLRDAKAFIDSVKNPRKGCSNPAVSAAQYRLAQAVLSGTAKKRGMPRKVAREIVDRTPANLRSEWSNPISSYTSALYNDAEHQGYELGAGDFLAGQRQKQQGEIDYIAIDTFRTRMDDPGLQQQGRGHEAGVLGKFRQGYKEGWKSAGLIQRRYPKFAEHPRAGRYEEDVPRAQRVNRRHAARGNPYYSLAIFDGVSRLGGRQEFSAPTLVVAQEKAQSYADDMGYDAVLYDVSGKSLGRFKTQRAIYEGRRHEGPRPNPATDPFQAGAEAAQMYRRINIKPDRNSFLNEFKKWKKEHGKGQSESTAMERFTAGFRSEAAQHWSNPEPLPGVIPPDSEPDDESSSDEKRQAERVAKLFHGTAVRGEIVVQETMREQEHEWYVSIGPLVSLKGRTLLKRPFTLKFSLKPEGLVHLFCSPDGKQFYLRGGDQEIDLGILGMGPGTDWYRDQMVIGQGKEITYRDRKKFHRFQLTDYYHKLGEETKVKPWITFDTLNKKLGILGGQYRVETKELVDGMSPGIVN